MLPAPRPRWVTRWPTRSSPKAKQPGGAAQPVPDGDGHIHALWFNFATGGTMRTARRARGRPAGRGRPVRRTPLSHEVATCGGAAQPVPHRRRAHPRVVVQLRHRLAPRGPHRDGRGDPRRWATRFLTPSSPKARTSWSSTTCSARVTATSTRCGSTSPLAGTTRTARRWCGAPPAVSDPVAYTGRREQGIVGAAQPVPHGRRPHPRDVVQLRRPAGTTRTARRWSRRALAVGDPAAYAFVAEPGRGGAAQPVPYRRWPYPRVVVQLRHWLAPRGPHRHDPLTRRAVADGGDRR